MSDSKAHKPADLSESIRAVIEQSQGEILSQICRLAIKIDRCSIFHSICKISLLLRIKSQLHTIFFKLFNNDQQFVHNLPKDLMWIVVYQDIHTYFATKECARRVTHPVLVGVNRKWCYNMHIRVFSLRTRRCRGRNRDVVSFIHNKELQYSGSF